MDLKKYYDETSRIANEMKQTREKLEGLIDEYSEIRKKHWLSHSLKWET